MAMEAFLESVGQLPIPVILPVNGTGGNGLFENEEHLDSLLGLVQLNTNSANDVMNSTILGDSSASGPVANLILPTGAYLQIHGDDANMEPYISLPSSHNTSYPSENPMQKLRFHVNQENIHQQQQQREILQELLLRELQDRNPQIKEMIKQHRQQTQLQKPILPSAPQLRGFNMQLPKEQMRSVLQDHSIQQGNFSPLLDGGICSWRFKEYLNHLCNNTHDNGIAYWKKFVSEYYAPGAKKRWCFSEYENIELHAAGVFYPKSLATQCCDICGSRSGKGLEATFDIFPRLFKIKFESGVLDEILFLDSPRACKISSGLVLEYRKAIQESVYENFRVAHEGKLRVVFRHDLKILSWEFCAQHHEEFLLRRLVTPQVNQLVQAAKMYHNCASFGVLPEDLQRLNHMFVSAGNQLARNIELPLVNDLGYPKRFIRCLQIAEVVDSMKDLMAFSHVTKMGPIESLNEHTRVSRTGGQMEEKQGMDGCHANGRWMTGNGTTSDSGNSGLAFVNLNNQLSVRRQGHGSCSMDHSNRAMSFAHQSFNSYPRNEAPKSQTSEHGKNPHQALVDKLLHEMAAASRAQSENEAYGNLNHKEAAYQSNQKRANDNALHYGGSSIAAPNASKAVKLSKAASPGNLSATPCGAAVKAEPYSPEAHQSSAADSSGMKDLEC